MKVLNIRAQNGLEQKKQTSFLYLVEKAFICRKPPKRPKAERSSQDLPKNTERLTCVIYKAG